MSRVVLTTANRVRLLVLALAAGAALVWSTVPSASSGGSVGRSVAVWCGLAVAFVVTDSYLVHVNVGRHAHSFSFAFIPMVVGLFVVSPMTLLATRLVGGGAGLTMLRRQPIKIAFN